MLKLVTDKNWEALQLKPADLQQLQNFAGKKKVLAGVQKNFLLRTARSVSQPNLSGFYGSDKDRKAVAAALVGKESGNDVYRVDLSSIISEYIGETEKNLSRIFADAEKKDLILFFDEADALFGKRTTVKDSHDRYANIEVNYLLQRSEEYPGIIIFSFNNKNDIDAAFLRRFDCVIEFPLLKR